MLLSCRGGGGNIKTESCSIFNISYRVPKISLKETYTLNNTRRKNKLLEKCLSHFVKLNKFKGMKKF
jgi:hypothetical protein